MNEATRRCLASLRSSGKLAASSIGAATRRDIAPLFDAQVLKTVRSGGGEAVQLLNAAALDRFIAAHFPEAAPAAALPSRARAVRRLRNSKQSGKREAAVVLLRAFRPVECSLDDTYLDVAAITRQCGAAALVLTQDSRLVMRCRVGLVENQECFLHAERMRLDVDVVICTAGKLAGIMLRHLASAGMRECSFLHCPDYDPVGLNEYMRYKEKLGDRIALHIPDNLPDLFHAYGKHDLLTGRNSQMMRSLRNMAPRELRSVIELIDETNAGLEQEILILE